jgi:hypothetical protein
MSNNNNNNNNNNYQPDMRELAPDPSDYIYCNYCEGFIGFMNGGKCLMCGKKYE